MIENINFEYFGNRAARLFKEKFEKINRIFLLIFTNFTHDQFVKAVPAVLLKYQRTSSW